MNDSRVSDPTRRSEHESHSGGEESRGKARRDGSRWGGGGRSRGFGGLGISHSNERDNGEEDGHESYRLSLGESHCLLFLGFETKMKKDYKEGFALMREL